MPNWIRASACDNAACVEVAFVEDGVLVRNSAAPADTLWFTPQEWEIFVLGASQGDFSFWTEADKV